ncbi:hypothetical protein [Archangium sp.]|uniref:hypothetical protein n=1 Tax=Archangium sp. TaxID=1872627 RepID=UPI002D4C5AC2|nr:hypothetical protein [Archangium sp.]HYO57116.1 hypothetical protein [Archangium sp.]
MYFRQDVIAAIGNTPLTKLRRASEFTGCSLLGKAEFLNSDQGLPSVTGDPADPSAWYHWLDESKSPSLKRLAQSAAADNPRHAREARLPKASGM